MFAFAAVVVPIAVTELRVTSVRRRMRGRGDGIWEKGAIEKGFGGEICGGARTGRRFDYHTSSHRHSFVAT